MNADQQLLYEARVRNRQAIVAVAAGVLLVLAAALQLGGAHTKVDELTVDLITANKRFPLDLIASVINGIASLLIAWTLAFLVSAARARSDAVRPFIRVLAIVGGVLAAITGIAYAIVVAIKVHQFATTGSQTYHEANQLTSAPGLLAMQLIGQAGALLVAISFVLVSLNAMKVGLLSRFMGYLGIFAGALVLFQIVQIPVVQGYWLAALGYLLSGRWPTGVPPAWRSGRAEPWPSSAEMRARSGGRGGLSRRGVAPKVEPQPAGPPPSVVNGRSRSTTPKRKRKRRN
jgi:hypothetical protein